MKTALFQKIMSYLNQKDIEFKLFEHEPVFTSTIASNILGHKENEGTKSLALETEKGLIVITIAGDERVDFKRIKKLLDIKKIKMCNVETIEKNLSTEVGGLAPFGYEHHIQLLVSQLLFKQHNIYFNPGRNDATILISGESFKSVMVDNHAIFL